MQVGSEPASSISIVSVISRFLGSYLSDRIAIKYLYIAYGLSP